METALGWFGLIGGIIGVLVIEFQCNHQKNNSNIANTNIKGFMISQALVFIATIVFWAISMNRELPYSPGQSLGYGFLIGGISGIIASTLSYRHNRNTADTNSQPYLSMAFLSLFCISLVYLIFHGYPQEALIGYSIAAVMTAIISNRNSSIAMELVELWAIISVVFAVSILFAVYHFDKDSLRLWWSMPILMGLSGSLAVYTAGFVKPIKKYITTGIIIILLSLVYSLRVVHDMLLFKIVCGSVLYSWIVILLNAKSTNNSNTSVNIFSLILTTAAISSAFALWGGFGLAVALISILFIFISQYENRDFIQYIHQPLSLIVGVLLFKLFLETYSGQIGSSSFKIHYTLMSAIMGIGIGILLSSYLCVKRHIVSTICVALLFSILPMVFFIVLGMKAVVGLLFGLIMSSCYFAINKSSDTNETCNPAFSYIFVIAAQLLSIKFIQNLIQVELSRTNRIWIVGAIGFLTIMYIIIAGIISSRKKNLMEAK